MKKCRTYRRLRDNISLGFVLLWLSAEKENHQKKLGKAHFVCMEINHGCQEIVLPRGARQQFAWLWYFYIFCIENSIHHQFQLSTVLLKLLHHIILLFGFVILNLSDNKFIMFFGYVMFMTCKMQKSQAEENIFCVSFLHFTLHYPCTYI